MTAFTIRYNRTTNHIEGLAIRTEGGELNYSLSACGALTRNGIRMGRGFGSDDLAEVVAKAKILGGRKICKKCLEAAEAMLAATVEPVAPVVEVPAGHIGCDKCGKPVPFNVKAIDAHAADCYR
ncbi:hypothetical protein [Nocardia cyriacigeorgica]|uniref:hypothetical protein n=1 Tax=Nocardia cyriacigeorgica TaxID=135487 RepID=UPI002455BFDE|nr:hypothetical protein [Nocardia cyriacigeorgica]